MSGFKKRLGHGLLLNLGLPVAVTTSMLLYAAMRGESSGPSKVTEAYFAQAREAADEVPYTLPGGWIGSDVPVPTQAVDMLKPNVLVSRSYESLGGRGTVSLLLVQTSDIANLLNHYPPACYPGQGWQIISRDEADWTVDELPIRGTIYRMVPPGGDEEQPVVIYNFMLQANGKTSRDMESLRSFARQGTGRVYGGGQVQVLFYGGMDEEARAHAFESVMRESMPALRAILDGYGPSADAV